MYIAAILTSNRTDCCLINFFVPILCRYFKPMTIATVHSVHLPFSLNFIIYFNYFVRHITACNIL